MNDYDILKLLDEKSPVYLTDISPESAYDVLTLLRQLCKEGYVSFAPSSNGPYSLTHKGRVYYLKLQDALDNVSRQHAQQKTSNRFRYLFDFSLFVAGLLVEHYAEIFDAILGLFS